MDTLRKVEKRNRPPVSCEPCRTRRLKCDRSLPCESCSKRDKAASCHYAPNAIRSTTKRNAGKPRNMVDRLDDLETLLSSLVPGARPPKTHDSERIQSPESAAPSANRLTPETPHLQQSEDGNVSYIDPSHWQSILEDIREVREHLSPGQVKNSGSSLQSNGNMHTSSGDDPALYLGASAPGSLEAILATLPPQPICDKLVSGYFGMQFMVLGIIHPEKFQGEYKAFWDSPGTSSPLWIALLFAILSFMAALRLRIDAQGFRAGGLPDPSILQGAAKQCLILGNYATANEHALEAFILHMQSYFVTQGGKPSMGLWFEMGTVIRLAFRMGCHRDPGSLTGISPFAGEMRRRLWLNIVQIDALLSFQMGLPSMIPAQFCDTAVPRNLEHSDLRPGMEALPPSRPLKERTPVTYTIVKSGIMAVFKKIVSHTQLPSVPAYEATLELEREMRLAYSNVPVLYQRCNVSQSFMDSSGVILERSTIEILYLKGIIVLLRRFITYDMQSDATYEKSRRACVEAALDILARHADIDAACQPGGRLYEDGWMFDAIPNHDYLLAAMVLCMHVSVYLSNRAQTSYPESDLAERSRRALESSARIWQLQGSQSPDVQIAAEAINVMVKKVAEKEHGSGASYLSSSFASIATPDTTDDLSLPYAGTMAQMIDGNEVIDWVRVKVTRPSVRLTLTFLNRPYSTNISRGQKGLAWTLSYRYRDRP
ncbi:uncharacterized protein F5Z01DRAFT_202367 [Emericellopsis atlantica]|uniref:Zn(2)-C6 fungal-type domain-containing protein n=1 Tax=Emericellopsis atlantica TaxID=2614577 RepID=A0A9P7ZUH7_9HYPO|nr:uncharacterized protein F5Z01DRAFT_202367 [Emericellopsis atlantica]KAG9258563.1 hypothetical protein F5Z01DRAFT_202367 [Emericellopsis atlantica]